MHTPQRTVATIEPDAGLSHLFDRKLRSALLFVNNLVVIVHDDRLQMRTCKRKSLSLSVRR